MTISSFSEVGMSAARQISVSAQAMRALRTALERETGQRAATILQETGFAAGEALYAAFTNYVRDTYGLDRAEDLDSSFLSEALSGYFTGAGWGEITIHPLGASVFAVDSPNWAEAMDGGAAYPACHMTTGSLADLFTRLGGSQTAVIEVECRSKGNDRCRFLVGSPETLTTVYERMAAGLSYHQSLGLEEEER